jgi:hypothetical protein
MAGAARDIASPKAERRGALLEQCSQMAIARGRQGVGEARQILIGWETGRPPYAAALGIAPLRSSAETRKSVSTTSPNVT